MTFSTIPDVCHSDNVDLHREASRNGAMPQEPAAQRPPTPHTASGEKAKARAILAAIRTLNRLECAGETLRAALNALAVVAPDWLRAQVPVEWYERYGSRIENFDLPKTEAARRELAASIAADGLLLLQAGCCLC